MARTRSRARPRGRGTEQEISARAALRFTPLNWALLGFALLVLAVGYLLLAGGSTTAAPLLLVLGYVILMPLGLMLRPRAEPRRGSKQPAAQPGEADRGA